MPWEAKEVKSQVIFKDGHRFVRIPETFVLDGEEILLRQEKDGMITVIPQSPEGWAAIQTFHPFGDETDKHANERESEVTNG